jgi:peptide/nickel transport system ATP-binding protein
MDRLPSIQNPAARGPNPETDGAPAPILRLEGVHVRFPVGLDWRGRPRQYVHALNGVDLDIRPGETLGVVGESGCGKTTLAQLLIGLLKPTAGRLVRPGTDPAQDRTGGPARTQIVFQDPQSSLDPRLPVWRIISEPLYVQRRSWSIRELRAAAAAAAAQVEIPPDYLDRYPHEFSGGQRQRIAIARALIAEPELILLDEPTSALDISVQAQILNLLNALQRSRGLTYLLISHNVSVVRHMSDRVAVMYLGQIVELGAAAQVMGAPRHPYTRLLLASVPRLGQTVPDAAAASAGELPSNRQLPTGCFFRDRCPMAGPGCERPQALRGGVRCHLQADQLEVPCR